MRVQVPLSAPLKNQCHNMSIKINRFELTLNEIGIGVSFICFFHCLLVITISCGKKGNPTIDGKPVENKYYKNK